MRNGRSRLLAIATLTTLVVGLPTAAESPVNLVIHRRVVPAGSDLRVTINVARNADNRSLTIEADSGDYARSSTMQLDGEFEAYTHQYWFRQLPEGEYNIVARVAGTQGVRGSAVLTVSVVGVMSRK
jgi:hypothetical protein